MHRILKNLVAAVALVGATAVITSRVVSQQDAQPPDMAEIMEAWMKLAEPGPEHAKLARFAGEWEQQSTHYMPGMEPTTSTMHSTYEPILGGRFMTEHSRGEIDMMGERMPFEGFGIFGYDNLKQKHVYAWVDNMGTVIMIGEGDANAAGDEITYYSELPNPMTGGKMHFKSISRIISDDHTVFEMHEKQPDGSWTKGMEIVGKRKQP